MHKRVLPAAAAIMIFLAGCSSAGFIAGTAKKALMNTSLFQNAHTGISIYDVESGRSIYDYQGSKYFVPASNVKIFTLYAGMRYLKDSLAGIRYIETADSLILFPTADPTLLHPDFPRQPVVSMLQQANKKVVLVNDAWQSEALGKGWSWGDFNAYYMAERSSLPVYGNVIRWIQMSQRNTQAEVKDSLQTYILSDPEINWKVGFKEDPDNSSFMVKRKAGQNYFEISQGSETYKEQSVPFITNGVLSALELLKDTVHKEITVAGSRDRLNTKTLYSQPSDSLYKMMMYRSDNFFAEQLLLMVSNEMNGVMNEGMAIDTLLKSELKGLPQTPTWVDGSGLSRYNLFSPQDFVWILNKMKDEFGLERLKAILPGGSTGTLANYFRQDSGYIFAKTGTLTGQVALSGYLITKKNKLLIFSVLVNNHRSSATDIRQAVESFLITIRQRY